MKKLLTLLLISCIFNLNAYPLLKAERTEGSDLEIKKIETKGFVLSGEDALFTVEVKNIGQNQITDGSVNIVAGEYNSTTAIGDLDADASKVLEITFPAAAEETEYTATIESASDNNAENNTATITVQAVVNPVYGFNFEAQTGVPANFVMIDKNNPKAIFAISPESIDKAEASVKIDDFIYFNSLELVEEAYQPKDFCKINLSTGEVTTISTSKISFKGLAHSPNDNTVYGIGIDTEEENAVMSLYKVNLETGATTKIASNNDAKDAVCFAIDSEDLGYIIDTEGNFSYITLNKFEITHINKLAVSPISTHRQSMAFDHEIKTLVLSKTFASDEGNKSHLSKLNRSTGAEERIGLYNNLTQITGLSFSNAESKVIYSEGFNEWPLAEWQVIRKGNLDSDSWKQDLTIFSEGTSSANHFSGTTSVTDWLISPQMEIGEDMVITFDECNRDMNLVAKHEVLISTESGNPDDGNFTVIGSFTESAENWTERTISLEEYAGSTVYIAFKYSGRLAAIWSVDNFKVKKATPKEIAVTACNIPAFTCTEGDLACKVTVANLGIETITDADVNLAIGEENFTQKVTLEPGVSKEIEITTFNFTKNTYAIVASADLEGDENAQNNVVAYTAYVQDPISDAYGYVVYSADPTLKKGPVTFNPENAMVINNMDSVSSQGLYPFAGTMINNIWYCNFQVNPFDPDANTDRMVDFDNNSRFAVPWMWASIDTATGSEIHAGKSDKVFYAMSYDYKNDKVYAITPGLDADNNRVTKLYTVNLLNNKYTLVGNSPVIVSAFAINKDGEAYAICDNSNFYSINLENAEATLIGNTGIKSISFAQTMAFEHTTDRLFWSHQSTEDNLAMYYVDTETGEAAMISRKKGNAQITALAFPYGNEYLHSVTFHVSDKNNSNPILEAEITVNGKAKLTDGLGYLTFFPFDKNAEIEYSYEDGDDVITESVTVDKDLLIELKVTGLEDFIARNINIYPNPSKGRINITNLANNTVTILDMQGKVVSSIKVLSNNHMIDLSNLNNGMYILKTIVDGSVLNAKISISK
ncbi:MAG: choice-of-anchor J domain-containing protein [Hyphomicrobiales bacterium]